MPNRTDGKPEPITKIAFRYIHGNKLHGEDPEILAVMPEDPGTDDPFTCTCYAHMGQHGSCDVQVVMQRSRPARVLEYAGLKRELESIGYRIKVVKRIGLRQYLETRRKALEKQTLAYIFREEGITK